MKSNREITTYVRHAEDSPERSIDFVPNATQITIEHDLRRKQWRLELCPVQLGDRMVRRSFALCGPKTDWTLQLADAPRFNARQLQTYGERFAPHYDAMAAAFRAGDRAELDALVIGALDGTLVPGYTSKGARLLQSAIRRHGAGPAIVEIPATKNE